MKLIISILVLVVVLVVGIGTWKPHAITALMIRLGLVVREERFQSLGLGEVGHR
jgi:hypothetical protein